MSYLDDPLFQPTLAGGHGFPSTWRYMLPKGFFALELPREHLADCDNCPMVAIGEFLPDCRCCTHFAQIPNFQLGLALKDPRTRKQAQAVIENGHALPEGIEITPVHYMNSVVAYVNNRFGKVHDLVCPFMQRTTGGCLVYPYRSAICATYHCGHDHCEVGSTYWETMADLVGHVETALSQWVMGAVGLKASVYMNRRNQLAKRVSSLSAAADPRSWSSAALDHLFGDIRGKEAEFFEACADQVMVHRNELWDIACRMQILEANDFDAAVAALEPADDVEEVPAYSNDSVESPSIADLWDGLQTATDGLWSLPESDVFLRLNPDASISANPKTDPLSCHYQCNPFKLVVPKMCDNGDSLTTFITEEEARALRLLETPMSLRDGLLDHPEIAALPHPRGFLAEGLRCGIITAILKGSEGEKG